MILFQKMPSEYKFYLYFIFSSKSFIFSFIHKKKKIKPINFIERTNIARNYHAVFGKSMPLMTGNKC